MKLKCIKPVVMNDKSIAFEQGVVYEFQVKANGGILRSVEGSIHVFNATGPDAWTDYFSPVSKKG